MVQFRKVKGRTLPVLVKKPKEEKLEKYAQKTVEKSGARFWKLKFIGVKGAPDRILIGFGTIEFFEFKRSRNEDPSDLQWEIINFIRDQGFKVHVIHSKAQFEKEFRRITKLSNASS